MILGEILSLWGEVIRLKIVRNPQRVCVKKEARARVIQKYLSVTLKEAVISRKVDIRE